METLTDIEEYPVKLTEKAVQAVLDVIKEDKELEGQSLRVSVQGSGCSGFSNVLTFSQSPNENDFVLTFSTLQVFIDPISSTQLEGTVIDYISEGFQSGFKFNIPNSTSCACGASYSRNY